MKFLQERRDEMVGFTRHSTCVYRNVLRTYVLLLAAVWFASATVAQVSSQSSTNDVRHRPVDTPFMSRHTLISIWYGIGPTIRPRSCASRSCDMPSIC